MRKGVQSNHRTLLNCDFLTAVQMIVEHFWSVPELIAHIMEYLDNISLCQCARVSKVVSCHALEKLYRSGVAFENLLSILAPIGQPKHPLLHIVGLLICTCLVKLLIRFFQSFIRHLTCDDWDCFSEYARLVRSLSFDDSNISHSSFCDVLDGHPRWEPHVSTSQFPSLARIVLQRLRHSSLGSLRQLFLERPGHLDPCFDFERPLQAPCTMFPTLAMSWRSNTPEPGSS